MSSGAQTCALPPFYADTLKLTAWTLKVERDADIPKM